MVQLKSNVDFQFLAFFMQLISDIFLEMLEFDLWHFCKMLEIPCIKNARIKSRHLT